MAPGAELAARGAPQSSQNLLPASTLAPQLKQTAPNVAPHSRQNRAPSRFSDWQRGHFMATPPQNARGQSTAAPRRRPSVAPSSRTTRSSDAPRSSASGPSFRSVPTPYFGTGPSG